MLEMNWRVSSITSGWESRVVRSLVWQLRAWLGRSSMAQVKQEWACE